MREYDWDQLGLDELEVLELTIRDEIDQADNDGNAVLGHDLRCLLDQCVAEQEKRIAAPQDDAG